ncbi:hypothetical protein N8878_02305 [Psychromonas sp.]|nr:hypothetical protein [Psychromonas sp.]
MNTSKINTLTRIISCVFFAYIYVGQVNSESFHIIIPADVKQDYLRFLDGRDPLSIHDFDSKHARRDVVEVVLLEQALSLGGNQDSYKILTGTSTATNTHRLEVGSVEIIGTSVWKSMFSDQSKILFSSAMIENGRFVSGLYTSPHNQHMLSVKTKQDLKDKSAISSRMWSVDWKTLPTLNLSKIWHTDQWKKMVEMVNNQQVDFLIAPFQSSSDLALVINGVRLIPVPGVKVIFHGTRHFAVSKTAKNGEKLLEYINNGISQLQAQNMIEKAYNQAGFYNHQVKDWQQLND